MNWYLMHFIRFRGVLLRYEPPIPAVPARYFVRVR